VARRIGAAGFLVGLFEAVTIGTIAAPAMAAPSGYALAPTSPATLAVPRTSFQYVLKPGQSVVDSFELYNFTNHDEIFTLYPADGYNTPVGGGFTLRPQAWHNTGVGTWISLPVRSATVPAQTARIFTFTLTVPAHPRLGDSAGGVVAIAVGEPGNVVPPTQSLVRVEQGVGSAVFVRVEGAAGTARARGTVSAVGARLSVPSLSPFVGTSRATVTYEVVNTGNVILNGVVRARATNAVGATEKIFPTLTVRALLPGSHVRVVEPRWSPLPVVGPQHIEVTFVPEGAKAVSTGATIWIVPWLSVALAVVILVALPVGLVVIRRRRRNSPVPLPIPVPSREPPQPAGTGVGTRTVAALLAVVVGVLIARRRRPAGSPATSAPLRSKKAQTRVDTSARS
jgi:hypothetical protein